MVNDAAVRSLEFMTSANGNLSFQETKQHNILFLNLLNNEYNILLIKKKNLIQDNMCIM